MANRRSFLVWAVAGILTLPLLSGCAGGPRQLVDANPVYLSDRSPAVFVTNGAGNYQMTSMAFRSACDHDSLAVDLITHDWSHGKHRILADHLDYYHARMEGRKLAERVMDYREAHPDRPIHLLSHSAGCTVSIAALEDLPPGVVDRAILLAPALSTDYDLRPALRSVRKTIHVFHSPHDYIYLGIGTRILGTPNRRWTPSAGRVGFQFEADPQEPELAEKLVQRHWQPGDVKLGNAGGHYGCYQHEYLRARVLPLIGRPTMMAR